VGEIGDELLPDGLEMAKARRVSNDNPQTRARDKWCGTHGQRSTRYRHEDLENLFAAGLGDARHQSVDPVIANNLDERPAHRLLGRVEEAARSRVEPTEDALGPDEQDGVLDAVEHLDKIQSVGCLYVIGRHGRI
jgi:hypothetical protein